MRLLHQFEMIVWVLSFILFVWCDTLIDFPLLGHPCIPEVNPLNLLLNLVCRYFIEEFCINIHRGYWSVVLSWYFYLLLSGLCWPQNELGSVSSCSIFGKMFEKDGISYSLLCWAGENRIFHCIQFSVITTASVLLS